MAIKIERLPPTPFCNSYETAIVKAEPKSSEEQKRVAEKAARDLERRRQQNPSFQNPN